MADNVTQGLVLGFVALVFLGGVTVLFVRSLVSFRYWVGWSALGGVLLAMGIVVAVVPREWEVFGLRFVDVAFAAFLFVVLLVAVQLSISISGHRRMLTAAVQECAELRYRVELLEAAADDSGEPAPASTETPSGASDGSGESGGSAGPAR